MHQEQYFCFSLLESNKLLFYNLFSHKKKNHPCNRVISIQFIFIGSKHLNEKTG